MTSYDDMLEAIMYLDMLKQKNLERVPQELIDNKDLILYAAEAMHMTKSSYNYSYPLLKQGLNKQFEQYIKKEWLDIVYAKDFTTILDIGAGNGAYLNAIDPTKNKVAIDNKPMGSIKKARLIEGKFPRDMNNNLTFDVIVMNEFLHLFSPSVALNMIKEAKKWLNKGGRIIIVENLYSEALEYRLNKLGGGYLYTPADFQITEATTIERHWIGVINETV